MHLVLSPRPPFQSNHQEWPRFCIILKFPSSKVALWYRRGCSWNTAANTSQRFSWIKLIIILLCWLVISIIIRPEPTPTSSSAIHHRRRGTAISGIYYGFKICCQCLPAISKLYVLLGLILIGNWGENPTEILRLHTLRFPCTGRTSGSGSTPLSSNYLRKSQRFSSTGSTGSL